MAVDERGRNPAPAEVALLARGVQREIGGGADPGDPAVVDGDGRVVNRTVAPRAQPHRGGVRVEQEEVPVGHDDTVVDCKER